MRFYCATLSHETNRFSPMPTNLDAYREFYLYRPSTGEGAGVLDAPMEGVNLFAAIKARGHDVVCGLAASAQPGAPTGREDFALLKDELLNNLRNAGAVDAVALFLHGAQVAEGCDDCEGEILRGVREIVGPEVPVGIIFDLHGNVTETMVANTDLLIACKEYPHFDFEDRADQLTELLEQMVRGEIRPVTHLVRAPLIGTYFTTSHPMRDFVDELYEMEREGIALTISLCHGFALADIPEAGAAVIVTTNDDAEGAEALADKLAQRWFDMRQAIATLTTTPAEALDQALAAPGRPVVIADITDNPGGGAPGDSTFLLKEMISRGVTDVALAMICDPQAASLAARAGEGAHIPLRIGGKMGPTSGDPLDVDAKVLRVRTDASQMAQGMKTPFGLSVAIDIGGIEVVLNSLRNQTFTPECFTEFGIDPKAKKILVVKSHQHFHEHFASFAAKIIYCAPPGTVDMKLQSVPYQNIRRPAWPLDQVPFKALGREWS